MPTDLTGVPGTRQPTQTAARMITPMRAIAPATAIGPIAPLVEADASSPSSSSPSQDAPLGRSGVSRLDVLLTDDVLVERASVDRTALDVGLEAARGALLRHRPDEALRLLDEVWTRASDTEEGWYLRAGALTLHGLPEDADRVADRGLDRTPHSTALRFLQSVARSLAANDLGARTALLAALDAAPDHPVLLAQFAQLLRRQGRPAEAARVLTMLRGRWGDHPATAWAEASLRTARADAAREVSRPASMGGDDETASMRLPESGASPVDPADPSGGGAMVAPEAPDVADDALARLGVRLGVSGTGEALAEVRRLLRAFSAGGALAGAVLPDQAHGARVLLGAIAAALQGEREHRAASAVVVSTLVAALREGRADEVVRLLRRDGRTVPPQQRRWLDALVREVLGSDRVARATPTPPNATLVEGGEAWRAGPDVPVRLGLALLPELAVRAEAFAAEARAADTLAIERRLSDGHPAILGPAVGRSEAAALDGSGFARVAATSDPSAAGLPGLLAPLLAVTVAAAAGWNGATGVAITALLAAIAMWLAWLRRENAGESGRTTVAGTRGARAPEAAVRRLNDASVGFD